MNYITTGSELTSIANAIREKGGTTEPLTYPSEFVSAIEAIPTGGGGGVVEENDVNFIDYDGTIVYSYSANEFLTLSAMPDNPTHDGLTAQGWNWSLTDAQSYVSSYGILDIGQMYTPTDGKLHVFISLSAGRLNPYFGLGVNGTAVIDWGDSSTNSTLTGTSISNLVKTQHTYSTAGEYEITVSITGSAAILGNSYGTYLIAPNNVSYATARLQAAITKVICPTGITIDSYAFAYCQSLTALVLPSGLSTLSGYVFSTCSNLYSITTPNTLYHILSSALRDCISLKRVSLARSITTIDNTAFYNCQSLYRIALPNQLTSLETYMFGTCTALTRCVIPNISAINAIGNDTFASCYTMTTVAIPDGVTSLGSNAFRYCYCLPDITVPAAVTSISSNAFNQCTTLGIIKFESSSPPAVASSNVFSGVPTDCKIYVPAGKLSAYTTATNYPSSSTYTYVEY